MNASGRSKNTTAMVGIVLCVVTAFSPAVRADESTSPMADVDTHTQPAREALNTWAAQKTPTAGVPQTIGTTTGGCITGAAKLPRKGPGYWTVRPDRASHYGHPDLIDYIEGLGRRALAAALAPVPIGDMSLPRGGPYPAQHRSHQSGLDVDIYYWRLDDDPVRPPLRPSYWPTPAGVTRGPPWRQQELHPQRIQVLKLASQDDRVDRILVNPKIKAALCQLVQNNRSWLRKVQPFWGHERHFHVRLHCPADSPECQDKPPPADTDEGCGPSLDWWFSAAARAEYRELKRRDRHTRGRNLPPACRDLPQKPEEAHKTGPRRSRAPSLQDGWTDAHE